MDVKVDDGQIWRNLLNNSYRNRRIISTIYKTSTTTVPVTFTCALTFVGCASISRNRLSVLNDESEQFEAISSSQVATIEPTVVSEESVQETRQSNSQLYYQQPYNNVAGPIGVSYAPQLIDGYPPFFDSDTGINNEQLVAGRAGYGGYGVYGGGYGGSYCFGMGSGACTYGINNGGIKGYSNNEGYGVSPGVFALTDSIGSILDHVHLRPFNRHTVHFTSVTSFSVLVTTQTKTLSTACNIDASSIPLCPKMG